MDEAALASYQRPECISVCVFYSPFDITGGGSLVIESEMEEKRRRGRGYEDGSRMKKRGG